jgi:hypothetical protein
MRLLSRLLILSIVAISLTGCFKKEKQGTLMRIAIYSQNVDGDPVIKAQEGIESYAFWIGKNDEWEVASWEDAINRRITNTLRPAETRTTPDVIGTFDSQEEFQLGLELWSQYVFAVIVDRDNKIYATRKYETPINLPEVFTHLHLYAWRKSSSVNGWNLVNPFPDEKRESLSGGDDEE